MNNLTGQHLNGIKFLFLFLLIVFCGTLNPLDKDKNN
jgi:hypothetical protein